MQDERFLASSNNAQHTPLDLLGYDDNYGCGGTHNVSKFNRSAILEDFSCLPPEPSSLLFLLAGYRPAKIHTHSGISLLMKSHPALFEWPEQPIR